MADRANIPVETLRQLLAYAPETGVLTWLERPREFFPTHRAWRIWNGRYAGTEALTADCKGHRQGNIFNRRHFAHRVGFALYYGVWPEGEVDHINGERADNRIRNLRAVGHRTNMQNQRARSTNTSGVTGVIRFRNKWRAQIMVAGKALNLGHFVEFDHAVLARKQAEERHGFHENHGQAACPK